MFLKNTGISNFMKIHLVGAKFLHADGQTGITELIVAFCNFLNTPKNGS